MQNLSDFFGFKKLFKYYIFIVNPISIHYQFRLTDDYYKVIYVVLKLLKLL